MDEVTSGLQEILLLSISVSAIQRSPDAHTIVQVSKDVLKLYELTCSSRQQLAYENTTQLSSDFRAYNTKCYLTYAELITGH